MQETLEELEYEETDSNCPECRNGRVYRRVVEPSDEKAVRMVRKICENHKYLGDGDCKHREIESECPDCGGDLEGETTGPGMFDRQGKVECTECSFRYTWMS